MTGGSLVGRLGRLQGTLQFKIIASAILTVATLIAAGSYIVLVQKERIAEQIAASGELGPGTPTTTAPSPAPQRPAESTPPPPTEPARTLGDGAEVDPELARLRAAQELTAQAINEILARRADTSAFAAGCAIGWAIGMLVIWLGLGLTYLALLLVTALIAVPLIALGTAFSIAGIHAGDLGRFVAGVVALTASFTALMEGLKLSLSTKGPITAIARNVVNEAVRMKVSLVFIVMLVFALAALPGLLNEGTPLRYRVQSFLQYGTGGAFWIIAVLVLFLSVGTVAYEQRDRVIWQTMTKPVAAWQYILGKWLGVVGVAAVLLAVATSGIFLFTEYLRNQPAAGERVAYVAKDENASGLLLTEDRFILETQVLAARQVARPWLTTLPDEEKEEEYKRRLALERQSDPYVPDDAANRRRIMDQIDTEVLGNLLTVAPGLYQRYEFRGLSEARESGRLLSLRYRIRAGGDDPRLSFRLSFIVPGSTPIVRQAPLDQSLTLNISPAAILPDGTLEIAIVNGDVFRNEANRMTISFPPDGIELYYSAGSYRVNFLRIAMLLWIKLAFLAIVGVSAATFLSFPVAALVAFGTFLMAEASRFLSGSLVFFGGEWTDKDFELWRWIVRMIAQPVIWIFQFYSNMSPTSSLVDGRLIPWSSVAQTTAIIGILIALLYAIGVLIFSRRELATYSGQ